jgi:predicted nucleic acid-binding Zn ribbon protein
MSEPPSDKSAQPDQGAPARRTGLEIAREALASARAEARKRGLAPGRAPASTTRDDPAGRRAGGSSPSSAAAPTPTTATRSCSGPTLGRLMAERGWETDAAVGGVMGRWAAIVGPEVAAHARPLAFDDGELVVGTDSTAWATQIRLLAPTLLARLAEELGAGVVRAVTVRGPSAPSWKKGLLAVRGRGPRDTYG